LDCVFCKILAGEIPGDFLYRDDEVAAFRDINPIAPTHVLIVPVKHIPSLVELSDPDLPLVAKMVKVGNELAKKEGIAERGYRLVINSGKEGTQLVQHLHMHLLGGRQLSGRVG
jgi:histidine triad (HIT) family protein